MSADNALFVQKNRDGLYAVQHGFMSSDNLPDTDKATEEELYLTLDEAINENRLKAADTEYGFVFPLSEPVEEDEVPAIVEGISSAVVVDSEVSDDSSEDDK